jgi:hypothetical protein
MTFPGRDMRQGTFTVGSTVPDTQVINCGFIPTKVELINMTLLNTSMAGGPPVANPGANYLTYRAVWNEQFASSATPFTLVEALTPSALTSSIGRITSNGISAFTSQITPSSSSQNSMALGPKIAGTNTAIATATFTITSTATLYPGALILMTANSVNKQLGGMLFTVNTVASGTTFTIANAGWLNTANFTNGAETFFVQLVSVPPLYYPKSAVITAITAANPAVVTTSVNLGLTVGQQVRLRVPSTFGMTQANNVTAIVSAVSGNQVTLGGTTGAFSLGNGLNSSAFTAFAWPAASSVPFNYAQLIPIGSGPTLEGSGLYNFDSLADATANTGYQGFVVGSGILNTPSGTVFGATAADVWAWTAWRADQ